jgi:hypothetical protein
MLIAILLALTLGTMQQETGQTDNASSSYKELPRLCNYAKVYNLKNGSRLSVRSGPGKKFPRIDSLKNGRIVFTCDGRYHWYQIFYGDKDHPCVSESPDGIDFRKVSSCKSGWVDREYIDLISG